MFERRELQRNRKNSARGSLAVSFLMATILFLTLFFPVRTLASILIEDPIVVYSIDFTDFTGSGFSPEPSTGQLDSDTWRVAGMSDGDQTFGGTFTTGDYAKGQSTGGVGPSGIYAFEVSPGVVTLGIHPSNSDFTPGELVLRLQNETWDQITSLSIEYDLWVNNLNPFASAWYLEHSPDDLTYVHAGGDFTSGEAADSLGWQKQTFSIELNGLSVDHGEYYYLKWVSDDAGGHGQRDEFGLNHIMLAATVSPVNYPPYAVDDSDNTAEDTSVTIDAIANDGDPDGDSLLLESFTQPANGIVNRDDNGSPGDTSDDRMIYAPDPDWNGVDSFSYTISDGNGESASANVTVTVTPQNDPPDAADDSEVTGQDTQVAIDVLANDTDPEGDTLHLESYTQPSNGVVTRDESGTPADTTDDQLLFMPAAGWSGEDSFSYTITDGSDGQDTANVTVTVEPTYPYVIYLPLVMR